MLFVCTGSYCVRQVWSASSFQTLRSRLWLPVLPQKLSALRHLFEYHPCAFVATKWVNRIAYSSTAVFFKNLCTIHPIQSITNFTNPPPKLSEVVDLLGTNGRIMWSWNIYIYIWNSGYNMYRGWTQTDYQNKYYNINQKEKEHRRTE